MCEHILSFGSHKNTLDSEVGEHDRLPNSKKIVGDFHHNPDSTVVQKYIHRCGIGDGRGGDCFSELMIFNRNSCTSCCLKYFMLEARLTPNIY
jgi:hypothetical protein